MLKKIKTELTEIIMASNTKQDIIDKVFKYITERTDVGKELGPETELDKISIIPDTGYEIIGYHDGVVSFAEGGKKFTGKIEDFVAHMNLSRLNIEIRQHEMKKTFDSNTMPDKAYNRTFTLDDYKKYLNEKYGK